MEHVDTLFGYPVPFPKHDLFIAFAAVVSFLPIVVLLHFIIAKIASLFNKEKTA